jgi:hypothetical protein
VVRQLELPAEVSRTTPTPSLHSFMEFFKGFENMPAVQRLFGEETRATLGSLKVEFISSRGAYMAVSHRDAHLIVSRWHLRNSDFRTLYLDIVHELFHVRQFMHEKESFIRGYEKLVRDPKSYFRNPIEVAAYRYTVAEAERIGMTNDEITEYLAVLWSTLNHYRAFLRKLGLSGPRRVPSRQVRPQVEVSRDAPITLHPFTDYFKGFENVPGVRRLFGDDAEKVLAGLKVEHTLYPLGYMGMDFQDAHLVINSWHLRDSELSILYLDLFYYLQCVGSFLEGRWDLVEWFVEGSIRKEDALFRDYATRLVGFDDFASFVTAAKKKDFSFFDAPIAIEAFRATVDEGRRIGMTEAELGEYVYLPGLGMTRAMYRRFKRNLGIGQPKKHHSN